MKNIEAILTAYMENTEVLIATARTIVSSVSEAEDIVQNTLLKFIRDPEKCPRLKDPLPYLRTCVRNEALNYLRGLPPEQPAPACVLEENVETREEGYSVIEDLMWANSHAEHLPPKLRDAFIRYAIDGWPIAELAEELGMKRSTLTKRFRAIMDEMKKDVLNSPTNKQTGGPDK